RKEILDILHEARKKTTVLFSTHILSDAEKICDEIALLHKGKIVLAGKLDDIRSIRKSSDVELEIVNPQYTEKIVSEFNNAEAAGCGRLIFHEQSDEEMGRLMSFLSDKKILVSRLERIEPDLETVFMEAIKK
ncbi:MAG: ABC transporter ATP-binding protein, partial [Coprococcus sp.]